MSGIASEENHVVSLSVFVSVVAGRSAASPAPEVRMSLCPLPHSPDEPGTGEASARRHEQGK